MDLRFFALSGCVKTPFKMNVLKYLIMCTFQILGACQGRRTGVGVTTVSNSLIFGGWVTKVLKNSDKNGGGGGVEGWVTTIFRLFRPTVLDKKCHFPVYFYTHLPIY